MEKERKKMIPGLEEIKRSIAARREGQKMKREAIRKAVGGGLTDTVYKIIQRSSEGVSPAQIQEKTGLSRRKIYEIVDRLKKAGRVKNLRRGLYGKA